MVFVDDGKETADGRTFSAGEAVEAAWCWLNNVSLDDLYGLFGFVDWQKRELTRIQERIVKDFPDLAHATSLELRLRNSDLYSLWFRNETRSAFLHFDDRDKVPLAIFHWDQCELFRFKAADTPALAAVLKRWLCDSAPPSSMRQEFHWLQIGKLADYYENGNPIEGEFLQSWDKIEQFYNGNTFGLQELVPPFLAELRRAGYDRKLRAGQSMWTLVLSRSRRHGLRADQPCVRFEFQSREGIMDIHSQMTAEERVVAMGGIAIAFSSQVQEELARLVNFLSTE